MLSTVAYLVRPDVAERALDTHVLRPDIVLPSLLSYAPHSFLQEVLARGVFQNSLQRVLNDRSGIITVIVASMMSGLFHSYLDLAGIAATTVSGVIFGCPIIRHGNLIGATIVHVAGGEAAFALSVM